ncbi:uncharacterized protein MONBRDRAFT_4912 [Monosiga brevicollis MX1]|uniref:Uncharacterized protein n=1 Tax=Monosiga brevicollis TaxID=81824 RepID=A9UPB5_MONBE|nr:uncharacterized protein MONBRDRAFT_4912 [Monosiga brevicollis MX1]EDQ92847.1 predicted protein [Monosiga brevicollis MX1]|eukprot:XP_001742609.1 hypothetical protein [Monosiga brevicollis MX1]
MARMVNQCTVAARLVRLVLGLAVIRSTLALDVFVATDGSDANSGTQTTPFATVERALAAIHQNATASTNTINLESGTYYLPTRESTININLTTAGLNQQQMVIQSATPHDPATLSGGILVTNWSKTSQGFYEADLSAWKPRQVLQLWANNKRQRLARTSTLTYLAANANGFTVRPEDLTAVPDDLSQAQAVMFESWTASIHTLRSIDRSSGNISFYTPYNAQWASSAAGARFYFQNTMEALDHHGEFFYNASTYRLTWYPSPELDLSTATVVVPLLTELVTIKEVHNIDFVNLQFQHAAVDLSVCLATSCDMQSAAFLNSSALHITNSSNVNFYNTNISHVGGYALWFDEDGGHFYLEGCGVLAQATAQTNIVQNLIRRFSYTGVSLGWTWTYAETSNRNNVIALNNIDTIGQHLLSDMGCIYLLGHQPGTKIDHNVCARVYSYNYGGWGLYTDQASRDITLTNNIVYQTKCAGLHQHFGLNNIFMNNVFADVDTWNCDGGIRSSQHAGVCNASAPDGPCSSFTFFRNILYLNDGPVFYSTIPTGFENMTFDNNTYYKLDHSSVVFPEKRNLTQWRQHGQDMHSIIADPLFTNPNLDDFSHLRPASPALARGFQPINISLVGPDWSNFDLMLPDSLHQHGVVTI